MQSRNLLTAIAAIVVAAALGYFAWTKYGDAPAGAGPTAVTGDLSAPGPLPDQVLGKADAPVTIIEYASMTCPHCADFHTRTYPTLKEKYIDTGKVRLIFREFPLDELALSASMLARCAGDGKYFPMVSVLFQHQRTWAVRDPVPQLLLIARQAGLSQKSFEDCMANQKLYNDIVATRERATKVFKVDSTPTFFINGKVHRGELTVSELDRVVEPLLKTQ